MHGWLTTARNHSKLEQVKKHVYFTVAKFQTSQCARLKHMACSISLTFYIVSAPKKKKRKWKGDKIQTKFAHGKERQPANLNDTVAQHTKDKYKTSIHKCNW